MPYTTRPLRSHTSSRIYAPFGVEVEIVRDGHPLLVRYNGEIFPCLADDLCEHVPEVIEIVVMPPSKPTKKQPKPQVVFTPAVKEQIRLL